MFTTITYVSILVISCCFFKESCGSVGDRSYEFQDCLYKCDSLCSGTEYPAVLPWQLVIFGWSCRDECKYQCMHNVTKEHLDQNDEVVQFYGKWPFVRFLGIQEPASVVFSIGNLVAHVCGWMKFSKVATTEYRFYTLWKIYVLLCINCWIWSSTFHARDLIWTERMDYFCATSLILYFVFASIVRIIGSLQDWRSYLVGASLFSLFSCYIYQMAFVSFNYGFNMKFNVTIGITNLALWLSWCFMNRLKKPHVWKCAVTVAAVFFLIALELGDFPPIWWTFDAHSIWHLSTVPFSYFWYSFLIDDAKHDALQKRQGKKLV